VACVHTGVRTEFRVSRRSGLQAGEVGSGRSYASTDVAMEILIVATAIAMETAGATKFQQVERNDNGEQRRRRNTSAAPSGRKSHEQWTIRKQIQELPQLDSTVQHLANLVEPRAAREDAQLLAMMLWMQEREQKWDPRHEKDKRWGPASRT
jgi:hypothetical protein